MADRIRIPTDDHHYMTGFLAIPEGDQNPSGKTLVIMMHGFPGTMSSHNNLFGDLAGQLAGKGLYVLRFDFQGCGESTGHRENFSLATAGRDLETVREWAQARGFKQFILIGEGLGGTAAIKNAAKHMDIKALALLWPVLDSSRYSENFLKTQNSVFGPDLAAELQKLNLVPALKEIYMPVLIIHGTEDPDIPADQINLAREHMRSKRLEITIFHEGHVGLTEKSQRKSMFFHLTQFIERQARS